MKIAAYSLSRWLAFVVVGFIFGTRPGYAAGPSRKNLLFVTDAASKAQPADQKIAGHSESVGCVVRVAEAGAVTAKAAGMDLVVISATVAPHRIESSCRELPVPVVTWNPDVLPELSMTGDLRGADFGTDNHGPHLFLYVFNGPHAMSGGLANGLSIFWSDSQYKVNWGRPGLGATVIATLPGQRDRATLFGYEKGALMNGTASAPARRAMLFLTDAVFEQLSEAGLRAFDAAILRAAGLPVPETAKTL